MAQNQRSKEAIGIGMRNMDLKGNFIDFHTHILPNMDDGATDSHISVEMLKRLKQQGVNTVILTPHFYTDKETLADFISRRATSFHTLLSVSDQLDIRLMLACEMYLTDYIFNYEDISPLCVNSGKYLLTELPFSCHFSSSTLDRISRLIATLNVVPVLAHIERYPHLMKDKKCLCKLIEMGCLAQINLDSLSDGFLQRRTLLNYINENLVHIVGTDCHNMTTRAPWYLEGIQLIEKRSGRESVETLMHNALQIIQSQ